MRRRTDVLSGLALAVLAVLLLVWIIPANTSPPQSENNLSPAFLPSVAALVILVLSVLLATVTWFSNNTDEHALHEEFGEEARGIGPLELADLAVWTLFAIVMMAAFVTVGFLPTAIAALALMMLYAGQRQPVMIAAVAIAIPLFIQQIAWHAFTVEL